MNIIDEQLIELIEGNENPEIRKALATDQALLERYKELEEVMVAIDSSEQVEVPFQVKANFQMALHQEKEKNAQWPWMQIAASVALLVVGFGFGKLSGGSASNDDLVALRNEIQSLKEVTLTSTLQRHSASERIMAVNQIEQKSSVNQELISTLVSTLNSDESPNVRYAALQALEKFISEEEVRAALVKSLEAQTDPLIQISLITILVEAEERSAIAPLKDIIENTEIAPEVKQQAEVAIEVLT
ncbi:MAG: HEAT repeat domain-containing protein [Ekhidna sp.]|nr:HEAT repeat domain-containing protein [Ekhidna sp.]